MDCGARLFYRGRMSRVAAALILGLAGCGPVGPSVGATSGGDVSGGDVTGGDVTGGGTSLSGDEPTGDSATSEGPTATKPYCQLNDSIDNDKDGIPNSCDWCELSPDKGAIDENCCSPLTGTCIHPYGWITWFHCGPDKSGARFYCHSGFMDLNYRFPWSSYRSLGQPWMPAGGLLSHDKCSSEECDCALMTCVSRWCEVGDDVVCEPGMKCIPWYEPGDAPAGLENLGICTLAAGGPCAGKVGRDCATWKAW